MLHLAKRNILVACACLALFGISSVAQEAPSDYQEVLKALDRKGDFKAGVPEGARSWNGEGRRPCAARETWSGPDRAGEKGLTIVLVTHEHDIAQFAKRVWCSAMEKSARTRRSRIARAPRKF